MKTFTQKLKTIILTSCLTYLASGSCNAFEKGAVIVVANIDQKTLTLTKHEIRNLFMGGSVGHELNVVELPPMNDTRITFNTKVVGLTEARIQSYWAQMRFSGRKKPPKQLQDETTIINYLQANKGSVAYLPADRPIPEGFTVLYQSN